MNALYLLCLIPIAAATYAVWIGNYPHRRRVLVIDPRYGNHRHDNPGE
jgi:hypothetical protein